MLRIADAYNKLPDSKVHGANMGPTWVLSAPDRPHVGPMNRAIREVLDSPVFVVDMCGHRTSAPRGWRIFKPSWDSVTLVKTPAPLHWWLIFFSLTVINMQGLSLQAPKQPKNAMKNTKAPATTRVIADPLTNESDVDIVATWRSSAALRSTSTHIPTPSRIAPTIWK